MTDLKNTSSFKAPGLVDVSVEYEVRRKLALALESERIMNTNVDNDAPQSFDDYFAMAKPKGKKAKKAKKKGKKA